MALLHSTASHHSLPLPTGEQMIPELLSLYCPVIPDGPNCARGRSAPQIRSPGQSHYIDPTLTSLAQLGTFRSRCYQAFVTLIDGGETYTIAESTQPDFAERNTPIKNNTFIGLRTLGLERHGLDIFNTPTATANNTRRIIHDLYTNHALRDHPFAVHCPHVRFYAEVPLYSSSGDVFGTYCVTDNAPRPKFTDTEVKDLQDVARSVAAHLENVYYVRRGRKADRLLHGLMAFVKSQPEVHCELNSRGSKHVSDVISPRSSELPSIDSLSLATQPPNHIPPPTTQPSHHDDTPSPFFQREDNDDTPRQLPPSPEKHQKHVRRCSDESSNLVTVAETTPVSSGALSLFSRASALLREGMELDGVMFFDASRSNSRSYSTASASDWDEQSADADTSASAQSPGLSSQGPWSDKRCQLLGSAVLGSSGGENERRSQPTLTEGLLHDMFSSFPRGEVFYPHDSVSSPVQANGSRGHSRQGSETSRSLHHAVAMRLGLDFPGSKSVAFVPLWNWDKSRWLAGTIIWTSDKGRLLGPDDLCYLRAFGDSIVSEYSLIGWTATEKSKSDLLSSVSHELRSPLHGMLASAELLQTTHLEPAQRDMVTMVETCGLTLLDTMNYLLDFTKINNLTHIHKGGGGDGPEFDNLASEFDLGTLVEDVAETLYAGHRSLMNASKIAGRYLPSAVGVGGRSAGTEVNQSENPEDLSVVVRVEEQKSWSIQSISGGWRRIVLNVLGNSFKFTRSGLIEVSLSQEVEGTGSEKMVFAHLSISDTGCGISPEFMASKLYKPFSQENTLTEGVGLGLSIVQQLVTSLGGYVDINSSVGVGTQVDVHIPIDFASEASSSTARLLRRDERPGSRVVTRVCLVGLNAYADLKGAPAGVLTTEAKRKLSIRKAMSDVLLSQNGWTVSFADTLSKGTGDIGVIEESSLKKIAKNGPIDTPFTTIIVLGEHGISLPGQFAIRGADIIYLSQPIGPRKITDALQRFIDAHHEASPSSESPIAGPFSGYPGRGRSLSEAFALAKGSESPPMARENATELSHIPTPQALNQKNIHVLVVDDNDVNLKILATFMRKMGCSYETATNGLAALDKYKNNAGNFDYVLMDISMPIMDGIVSSSKIREYEEQNSLPRTAIMAVTGVASSAMQQQAFAAGIDDYLVKPLSLHDLKRIMNIA
ncbi:hypothetical protein BDV25DRAFT_146661 [Aspergillus avenaceus]|uniref:Sensor histidine kinase/response regulator n=1 Tax=Aspergillus avenaceus TaxID=36643 RepID=A0A5N6U998_ASPAV|nr:hypothetical protein BDV25DRAFT_146661 [Aspergillus avenaceus]